MAGRKHKVLIIKTGYSETLDPEISDVTSYGDVLRSTVLLHLFKDCDVTWLVCKSAYPILRDNEYVNRILIYNLSTVLQLQSERFDMVINLEKVPGLCALADKIHCWRRFGFRFDADTGEAQAYDGSHTALSLCKDQLRKAAHKFTWQDYLYEMVGAAWHGEGYVFNRVPKDTMDYDIGFNVKVGMKWPNKAWPDPHWNSLEEILRAKYRVSWQQGLTDMEDYFRWINSCRMIISNDSFGLHLGVALNKKVIGLFGSTNPYEVYFYGRGIGLVPSAGGGELLNRDTRPSAGDREQNIALIKPEVVASYVERLFDQRESMTDLFAEEGNTPQNQVSLNDTSLVAVRS